jgi:hypothetical protein
MRKIYDEWQGMVNQAAASGHPRKIESEQDRLLYLVADLLEAGRGTLLDRKVNRPVDEITVNIFGERCGPALCGHDGRRFILPEGTVFLTVIDTWY